MPRTADSALVRALSIATFLQYLGASAVLAILPLYLARQGASDLVIGLAMGAFFGAGVLIQYPVGRLADRIGPLTVLVTALGALAIASLGYVLPVGPAVEVLLRFLQGAAVSAAEVASLSMVGIHVASERRGGAFGAIFGAQLAALAIAPLVGSVIGIDHMTWLFVAGAVAAGAACAPIARAAHAARTARPTGRPTSPADPESTGPHPRDSQSDDTASTAAAPPNLRLRSIGALRGVFIVGLVAGLTTGVYESCWTLLLESRGAASWQIGLSWCLFCVPFVAASVPAGRLADRFDQRWLVVWSLLVSVVLLFIYPFVSSLVVIITLGAFEGLGVAVAYPAAQSLLTTVAPPRQLGQTQGVFSTVQTAAIAISAALGGALFGSARWLPFVAMGVTSAILVAVASWIWVGVARPTA